MLVEYASIPIAIGLYLKYFIGVLIALHALGGFRMMILRRVRDELLSKMLESISLTLIMVFMIQITILEFIPL